MLKGNEVGADAQLSKPQIGLLVNRLKELLGYSRIFPDI